MFDRVPSPWPFPESFDRWRTHQSVNGNASDIYAEPDEVTWPSLPSRPPPVGIEWELPQPRQRFFEEHGVGRCPPNFDISEPIEEGSLKEWVYLVLGDSVNRNMEYAGGSTKWSELARGMRFPMDGAAIGLKKQHIFENGEQRRYCPPIEDYFRPHSEDWRPPEGFFAPPGLCLPPWHRIREDKMRREELGEDESPEEPKEEAKPVPRGRRVDVRALIRNRRDAKRSGRMAAVNKAPGAGWRSAPSPKTPPSPRVPPGPNSRAREVGGWDGVWPETDDGWGLPSCAAQVLESTRGPSKLCRDAPHSRPFAPPSSTPHRPQVHPSAKPAPDDSMRKGDHRWPANTGQRPSGQTWKPRGSQGWNGLNQKARAPLTSKQQVMVMDGGGTAGSPIKLMLMAGGRTHGRRRMLIEMAGEYRPGNPMKVV
ncbi:hypothetical protein BSKO_10576 [Bryopsis sp. KO-2023]|nr:hypothetical protein BSKO_10576 [Bryopsis sp. KO-2023]